MIGGEYSVTARKRDAAPSDWLVSVLPETARLVREYLPGKSKSYPSEQLAAEIDGLREMLLRTEYVDRSLT